MELAWGPNSVRIASWCCSLYSEPRLAVARIVALVADATSRGAPAGPAASSSAAATGSSATVRASPCRTADSASKRMPNNTRRAGDLRAHRSLQHPGRAAAGMQSELLETGVEQCGWPGDAHVGGQCQVQACADGRAVDRGDGGQLAIAHGHEAVVDPRQPRLRRPAARSAQCAEVGAGAERLARSRDQHGVHVRVSFGLLYGRAQQRRRVSRERVTPVRVVDGDERDVLVDAGTAPGRDWAIRDLRDSRGLLAAFRAC